MRWEGQRRSDNIEDRRGMRVPGGVGGGVGIGTVVVVLLVSFITGTNPLTLLQIASGISGGAGVSEPGPAGPPADDPQTNFVRVVLASTEDAWSRVFQQAGERYTPTTLVVFNDAVQSACGTNSAAVGPFYCPADQRVYIDLGFFRELDERFGAPGDFAQAYVVAHEVGHHLQTLLGVSERVMAARQRVGEIEGNQLSVRQELQADCFAGVWAHHAGNRNLLEAGDVEEAMRAAAAIGDDTIQRRTQGAIVPESFTHGTSEQRMRWFMTGMKSGQISACNTFEGQA
jgi:predicted metalloprotease